MLTWQKRGFGAILSSPLETLLPIENRQGRNRSAAQEARRHAENQGRIPLIDPMNHADHLQHTKPAKCDQRDSFIGLLPPNRQYLRYEEQGVAQKAEAEDDRDDLFHG